MESLSIWRKAVLAAAFCIAIALLVGTSRSFEACMRERKDHQAYELLRQESFTLAKPMVRLKLNVACGRVTLGENDGAITALATVILSVFTFALWVSTHRLWAAAREQGNDMKKSILVTERAAEAALKQSEIMEQQFLITKRSQLPMISYSMNKTTIKRNESKTEVEAYFISLVFKNTGLTDACWVNYWMDNLLCPPNYTPDIETLFKSEGAAGSRRVGAQAVFDTDIRAIGLNEMVAIYEKKAALYFWFAIRWGSTFDEPNIFMEAAGLLEFVIDYDPRSFGLDGTLPSTGPFRVASRGERYREGRDP